jgi:hypothetical protein
MTPRDDYTPFSSSTASDILTVTNEQATMGVRENDLPNPSTLNAHDVGNIGDSDSTQPEKLVNGIIDDQYPHGLILVCLAGASLIAVFLIALDQVSSRCTRADTQRILLMLNSSRLSSVQQFQKLPTSSTASKTCLGMLRPTS